MATTTIDGYRFSGTDAAKTLAHAIDLLDLYPSAVRAEQHARRHRVAGAVSDGDLATVWRELLAARDDAARAGALPGTAVGRVAQVNTSAGGVPKLPADSVDVAWGGVVGDRQAARVHHGRPWQALCLWSTEVIDMLGAEGHGIAPGAAGENVTVSGIDWTDAWPGVRLRLGAVLCQLTAYAVPCKKNAQWFRNGDFMRMHHSRGPVSRVYAVVLEPGRIEAGDQATLEP